MSFPVSPSNGQTAVVNNITYSYSTATTAWSRVPLANTANTGTTSTYVVSNTTSATSTASGALVVAGGVGIGGNLYAGNIYTNGSQVLPTSIQTFTATAGQTTFSITGGYVVGQEQVHVNGILLSSAASDYTANGSTIVLAAARNVGDIVQVVSAQNYVASGQQTYTFTQVNASSAGQNTFSATYNTATVQVFLNGLLVPPSNYTATNGSTIVFNTATTNLVTVQSVVGIVSFNSVTISNAISSSGGTVNGTLNVVGSLQQNGQDITNLLTAMSIGMSM